MSNFFTITEEPAQLQVVRKAITMGRLIEAGSRSRNQQRRARA